MTQRQIIVITGDIAGSTDLAPGTLTAGVTGLAGAAALLAGWLDHDIPFSRHRGDGWQVALPHVISPLRAALVMRAALRRVDRGLSSRMALATGAGVIPPDGNLNAANGSVFTTSGQLLDRLEGTMIAMAGDGATGAATRLAHAVSQGWTQAQARVALPMLAPDRPTQDAVAETLGITRQAVQQAFTAAHMPDILAALDMLEAE